MFIRGPFKKFVDWHS